MDILEMFWILWQGTIVTRIHKKSVNILEKTIRWDFHYVLSKVLLFAHYIVTLYCCYRWSLYASYYIMQGTSLTYWVEGCAFQLKMSWSYLIVIWFTFVITNFLGIHHYPCTFEKTVNDKTYNFPSLLHVL